MDRGRRIAARVLVTLGLLAASVSLSAWWAQAIITKEFPLLTSLALRSVESEVTGQLQAQLGASGLTPAARQAATNALDSPAVHQALASGDPGPATDSALVKADPALGPVLKQHPLSLPPVGRSVTRTAARTAARVRPLAALGMGIGAVLCALAVLVGTDRFRLARRVGWWGVVAGGLPLLVGRVLPGALGLAHGHGSLASLTRTELSVTEPLRALSIGLCAAGTVLVTVGAGGPYLVRFIRRAAAPAPDAAAGAGATGIGMPPTAWSASRVDVRL